MAAIMKVARKHKLKVIEDNAQACGGRFKGKLTGTIGDLGCFSISAYKVVGAGEGGLVLTNNQRLWERTNQVAEGGGLWRPNRFAPPRYDGELFSGVNYRMSELEAAVNVVQLGKMESMVARFRRVRRWTLQRLETFREITPQRSNDPEGDVGYTLRFFPETIELGDKITKALNAEGVSDVWRGRKGEPDWHCYSFMYPVTLGTGPTKDNCPFECPIYLKRGGKARYGRGLCPVADDLYDRVISVYLNQWYTTGDCRNIANGINKVLAAYCTPGPSTAQWL